MKIPFITLTQSSTLDVAERKIFLAIKSIRAVTDRKSYMGKSFPGSEVYIKKLGCFVVNETKEYIMDTISFKIENLSTKEINTEKSKLGM
jgi:hypothetical protein